MDLANLSLWTFQDTLLAALQTNLAPLAAEAVPLAVGVDLGFPTDLQPNHVWITGNSTVTAEYEETMNEPSNESFPVRINGLLTWETGTYADARTQLLRVLAAVTTSLASVLAVGTVDMQRAVECEFQEGRNGQGHRQLGFRLDVDCTEWTG